MTATRIRATVVDVPTETCSKCGRPIESRHLPSGIVVTGHTVTMGWQHHVPRRSSEVEAGAHGLDMARPVTTGTVAGPRASR